MIPPHFDGVLFVGFGGPTPGCCERFSPCPGSEAVCFVRAIIGERSKRAYRLGDRVRVRLDRIDRAGNKLQFAVVEP